MSHNYIPTNHLSQLIFEFWFWFEEHLNIWRFHWNIWNGKIPLMLEWSWNRWCQKESWCLRVFMKYSWEPPAMKEQQLQQSNSNKIKHMLKNKLNAYVVKSTFISVLYKMSLIWIFILASVLDCFITLARGNLIYMCLLMMQLSWYMCQTSGRKTRRVPYSLLMT